MTRTGLAAALLGLLLSACSPQEKSETREDLRKTGVVVKKELKNDAAFLKEQALKARAETQKGVKKLKQNLKSDDQKRPRSDAPEQQ